VDYAGKMQLMRHFWNAAVALDPAARDKDEGRRFPLCEPEAMRRLWEGAGFRKVEVAAIDIETTFRDFDDYWTPFLSGQAPAPGYCMSLSEDAARGCASGCGNPCLTPSMDRSRWSPAPGRCAGDARTYPRFHAAASPRGGCWRGSASRSSATCSGVRIAASDWSLSCIAACLFSSRASRAGSPRLACPVGIDVEDRCDVDRRGRRVRARRWHLGSGETMTAAEMKIRQRRVSTVFIRSSFAG
jgi:hypothetical protein